MVFLAERNRDTENVFHIALKMYHNSFIFNPNDLKFWKKTSLYIYKQLYHWKFFIG